MSTIEKDLLDRTQLEGRVQDQADEIARLGSEEGQRLVLVNDPAEASENDALGIWQAGDVVAAGSRASLLALQR